ncbi:hypothetical protein N4Q47_09555 [Riemerella anatipestifer]|uniref:hypothetical protein n=1 Tax=Riemerella anatipestifer TaxID=34085 RepID=UPI001BD91BC1|nr:hypothetical protein [Riemerella anatipestifer]MBT0553063.1 hypothetical protein [Riemerella anatipestifer]MCT6745086.1 hypothetical protein [Riemerella anatipestifer]MCU7572322.1 hypothetical protein [Riemerella anatipestifer]MCU7597092.1 hypothetical protein [Riemerella anatipestifer]MCU7604756.1 hypothetical protein [Riemerella anatipestifer]
MKNSLKFSLLFLALVFSSLYGSSKDSKAYLNVLKIKNERFTRAIEIELKLRNGRESIVSEIEYHSSNDFMKRIINYIDATISALNLLDTDVEAILSISRDKNNYFSNSILISKIEELSSPKEVYKGSCQVCGVSSAYSCVRKISKDKSLGDEFNVRVRRKGNCVELSW